MAAKTAASTNIPKGVNDSGHFATRTICPVLANTDTLEVALPDGVAKDSLPVGMRIWGPAASSVLTVNLLLALTSHNVSTGKTLLTASGVVAAGSILIIDYQPNDQV